MIAELRKVCPVRIVCFTFGRILHALQSVLMDSSLLVRHLLVQLLLGARSQLLVISFNRIDFDIDSGRKLTELGLLKSSAEQVTQPLARLFLQH